MENLLDFLDQQELYKRCFCDKNASRTFVGHNNEDIDSPTCLACVLILLDGMIFLPPVMFLVAPILYHIRDLGCESTIYTNTSNLECMEYLISLAGNTSQENKKRLECLMIYLWCSNDSCILVTQLGVLLDVLDEYFKSISVNSTAFETIFASQHPLS